MKATETAAAAIADLEAPPAAAPAMRVFAVGDWGDVAIARHQARRLARDHGVEPRRAGEVAIVVSELASNIVKYAGRGEIALCVTNMAARAGAAGGRGDFHAAGGLGATGHARDAR